MSKPITMTEGQVRMYVRQQLQSGRASGVPDDGIAAMLSQWFIAHLKQKSEVVDG